MRRSPSSAATGPDIDHDGRGRPRRSPTIPAVLIAVIAIGVVTWMWQPWLPADPNVPGSSHRVALVHFAGDPPRTDDAMRAATTAELNCPVSWSVTISGHHWTGRTEIPKAWWALGSIDGTLEVEARTGFGDVTTARFTADGQVVEMTGGTTGFLTTGCPAIA